MSRKARGDRGGTADPAHRHGSRAARRRPVAELRRCCCNPSSRRPRSPGRRSVNASPAEIAVAPVSPLTATGVELSVVVPLPSLPNLFPPQHLTPPGGTIAQVSPSPAEIAVAAAKPAHGHRGRAVRQRPVAELADGVRAPALDIAARRRGRRYGPAANGDRSGTADPAHGHRRRTVVVVPCRATVPVVPQHLTVPPERMAQVCVAVRGDRGGARDPAHRDGGGAVRRRPVAELRRSRSSPSSRRCRRREGRKCGSNQRRSRWQMAPRRGRLWGRHPSPGGGSRGARRPRQRW